MSEAPSTRQVFLGVFIVGQLLFLVSSNFIGFMKDNRTEMGAPTRKLVEAVAPGWPEERGHFWHLMEHTAKTNKFWIQATGQYQNWSLFAPTIGRECTFPALELRWDDPPKSAAAVGPIIAGMAAFHPGEVLSIAEAHQALRQMPPGPELVLSENEPVDLEHYWRFGYFRLRRYETNIVITLRPWEGEKLEEMHKRWSDAIRRHVDDYSEIIQGYLRWRLRHALKKWPERPPPRQVVLVLRRFHINDVDKAPPYWQGPFTVPLARLQPGAAWDREHQALEWYDPVSEQFKAFRK